MVSWLAVVVTQARFQRTLLTSAGLWRGAHNLDSKDLDRTDVPRNEQEKHEQCDNDPKENPRIPCTRNTPRLLGVEHDGIRDSKDPGHYRRKGEPGPQPLQQGIPDLFGEQKREHLADIRNGLTRQG